MTRQELSYAELAALLARWKRTTVRVLIEVQGRTLIESEGWLVEPLTDAPGVLKIGVAAGRNDPPTMTLSIDHEQYSWAWASELVDPLSVRIQLIESDAVVDVSVHRVTRAAAS